MTYAIFSDLDDVVYFRLALRSFPLWFMSWRQPAKKPQPYVVSVWQSTLKRVTRYESVSIGRGEKNFPSGEGLWGNNITCHFNGVEYLTFCKSVSIQKNELDQRF